MTPCKAWKRLNDTWWTVDDEAIGVRLEGNLWRPAFGDTGAAASDRWHEDPFDAMLAAEAIMERRLRLEAEGDDDTWEGSLAEFVAANELEAEERAEVLGLAVGASVMFGGGAFVAFTLARIS